jgi:hypothetical protein
MLEYPLTIMYPHIKFVASDVHFIYDAGPTIISGAHARKEQMPKFTITIEGDEAEVRDILLRLAGSGEVATASTPSDIQSESKPKGRTRTEQPTSWTPELFRQFWMRLTPNAKKIIGEIARHPDGIYQDDLDRKLGMASKTRSGTLSSVGHAMRGPQFLKLPRLVKLDRTDWKYKVDANFAKMLREGMGAGSGGSVVVEGER